MDSGQPPMLFSAYWFLLWVVSNNINGDFFNAWHEFDHHTWPNNTTIGPNGSQLAQINIPSHFDGSLWINSKPRWWLTNLDRYKASCNSLMSRCAFLILFFFICSEKVFLHFQSADKNRVNKAATEVEKAWPLFNAVECSPTAGSFCCQHCRGFCQ